MAIFVFFYLFQKEHPFHEKLQIGTYLKLHQKLWIFFLILEYILSNKMNF